jgi:hypothetical protein
MQRQQEKRRDHNRSRSTSMVLPRTARTWFNRKQNAGIVMTGCVVVLAIAEGRKKYIRGELASNATRCNTEGVGGTEELVLVAKSRVDQTRTNT